MGKFSGIGTKRVEITFAPRCQWTHGNLPVNSAVSADVIR